MEIQAMTAFEIKKGIEEGKFTSEEIVKKLFERIKEVDPKVEAYITLCEEEAIKSAKAVDEKVKNGEKLGKFAGVPIAIKDNICTDGIKTTCASKMLGDFIPPYDATVIKKLKAEDAVIIGKTNMDEFAMGSSNENSAYKKVINPWNREFVPGGSSGASAASVAAFETPIALGTETGGSVRQPASFCGVVGLKPTYGRISRYGVVAFGSTLDQVGTLGRDVEDCALLTQNIAGIDKMDFTTVDTPVQDYKKSLGKDIRGKKIGIPEEYFGEGLDDDVRKSIEEAIKVLEANGAEVKKCSLPLTEYALAAYYIISSAEASSNLARFDGIRFGHRSKDAQDAVDIYSKSRSEGFGKEVKRRIMLGTYALSAGYYDAYYKKALKVRNLIKQDFQKVFKEFDVLISPTSPTTAFKFGEKTKDVVSMYMSDVYTVPINIAGLPAISVPCGFVNDLPVGLQFIGNYFREDVLFNFAYSYETSTDWHKKTAVVE